MADQKDGGAKPGLKAKFIDGLKNAISGLGISSYDKNRSSTFTTLNLTDQDLTNAYRSDWIAGKICDIPAEDATREWRTWQAEAEQISAIDKLEKALKLQQKTEEALKKSRIYGGAGIVIGIRGADWAEPLDPSMVKKGDLQFLHVVDRLHLTSGQINWDASSPGYGLPEYYRMGSTSVGAQQIHPSRVVRFVGREYPRIEVNSDGWGDSVLLRIYQALIDAATSSQGIATLIQEAAIDVVKMPDLMANISTEEYKDRFTDRWSTAMLNKSINRTLVLDAEEEYDKKQISFSGLPDIIKTYLNIAAGAGDIPATRLLGTAPQGLNATGESDLRNYYDSVGYNQKNKISPCMSILDQCILASALGEIPKEIFYIWKPLWQQTEAEKTDNFLKFSQGVGNIYNTGLVPDYALGKGLQNRLVEDGIFPGIESALEEAEELDIEEDDPEAEEQFQQSKEGEEPEEEETPDDE